MYKYKKKKEWRFPPYRHVFDRRTCFSCGRPLTYNYFQSRNRFVERACPCFVMNRSSNWIVLVSSCGGREGPTCNNQSLGILEKKKEKGERLNPAIKWLSRLWTFNMYFTHLVTDLSILLAICNITTCMASGHLVSFFLYVTLHTYIMIQASFFYLAASCLD